ITGIGQGYMLATPLQLATLAATLANRGVAYRPHFNKAAPIEELPPFKLDNPHHWEAVIESMHQVTQNSRGTAYRYFTGLGVEVTGKTGTSQVFGLKANEKYNHNTVAHHLRDHTWFIAFAPVDEPKIALAVILENQRGGAQVARPIIEAYFTE